MVKKPPVYIDVPLMGVIAMPYITAPFLPDFDYQDAPDSPPVAVVAASTSLSPHGTPCQTKATTRVRCTS